MINWLAKKASPRDSRLRLRCAPGVTAVLAPTQSRNAGLRRCARENEEPRTAPERRPGLCVPLRVT